MHKAQTEEVTLKPQGQKEFSEKIGRQCPDFVDMRAQPFGVAGSEKGCVGCVLRHQECAFRVGPCDTRIARLEKREAHQVIRDMIKNLRLALCDLRGAISVILNMVSDLRDVIYDKRFQRSEFRKMLSVTRRVRNGVWGTGIANLFSPD